MKGLTLSVGLATLACLTMSGMAQDTAPDVAPDTTYTFETVNFKGDVFTQLLGINNAGTIAGYHGSGVLPLHPNEGFTLTLHPTIFLPENFPGAVQTQVIGISNSGFTRTCGFYVDAKGGNHGFTEYTGSTGYQNFTPVNFPGTKSVPPVNQLLGVNDNNQAAGFYTDAAGINHGYTFGRIGGFFLELAFQNGDSATATGINDTGWFTGFYVDKAGTHGFLVKAGTITLLNFPGSTFTQPLGLNNSGQVVGTYTDASGLVHGFVYQKGTFQEVDDPKGVGATLINGINDKGVIVGFYGTCATGGTTCDGFVGTP